MTDWASLRRDRVLVEDEHVLVLDKPAGISVTGERHGTDVVRLAADAGEELWPAHRIDKVTSGAVLLAKTMQAHGTLARQFNKRSVDKAYLAITRSTGLPERGTIDLPLTLGRKSRVRVAAPRDAIAADDAARWSVPDDAVDATRRIYPSTTSFARVWEGERHTLLVVQPTTGRRHQIRVHLAWIGHPIAGDPLFEKAPAGRTCLHAWQLAYDATWAGGARIEVEAPPGDDLWAAVAEAIPETMIDQARLVASSLPGD